MSFQSNSPLRFSRPRSNRAKGFALVVAISLMALTLLLMVSLSTLVRFEVQASNTAITQQMARSNALFALQAAIGQLQQHMGPDQAVSAPASLLDGDVTAGDGPDTVTGVVNPNWVGVWTYDDVPGQAAGRTTRVGNVENAVQAWLVSGADGTISPRAALTGETVELASPRNSLYDASVSHPAVTVPKVEMEEGAYAWWISDEGMKVNLSKPPLPGSSGSDLLAQVSPAVSGLTMVGSGSLETGNFGSFVTAPDDVTFARINSVEEVALAPETLQGDGFADVLDHGLHELTVSSVGLLTNTRDGGLRRDLSAMLASGAAAPDARIYSSAGAGDTGPGGPHWRQLQDFLHMADDNAYVDGTGRLIPRTHGR